MEESENGFNDLFINEYSVSNPCPQKFPFHDSFMNYITNNSNHAHKEKLIRTCKLFYDKYPYDQVIDKLLVCYEHEGFNEFDQSQISCAELNDLFNYRAKIWVKEQLFIGSHFKINDYSLSSVVLRCTANQIGIHSNISTKDFKMLIEAGTIDSLEMEQVIDDNGNPLPVEDIIDAIPNARYIRLDKVIITSKTQENLLLLKRNQEIWLLHLCRITGNLNVSKLIDFLKKYARPQVMLKINFSSNGKPYYSEFRESFENMCKANWEPYDQSPILYV